MIFLSCGLFIIEFEWKRPQQFIYSWSWQKLMRNMCFPLRFLTYVARFKTIIKNCHLGKILDISFTIFLSHGAFLKQTWCFVLVHWTLKQPRLCLSMFVGRYCLAIYLLNSFLCCHIIVIAPDLWDNIIGFNSMVQKQALPAVRRVLYLALCVVGRSEFPLWGPLTLTHRQRVTQSLPNTHTLCTAQSRRCSRARERANSLRKRTGNRRIGKRVSETGRETERKKPSGNENCLIVKRFSTCCFSLH